MQMKNINGQEPNRQEQNRKEYNKPVLIKHGLLRDITATSARVSLACGSGCRAT